MIHGVYCVRDVKTGFMTPTIDMNDQSAARNFIHAVRNADGILRSFSQDFDLYHIADFDSESGTLMPITPIQFVASGKDAIQEGAE